MPDLPILDHDATVAALPLPRLLEAVAAALVAVADGTASAPPRVAARGPHGLLGAMPGSVTGMGWAAKLVTIVPDPQRPGRSAHRGVVVAFDEQEGRPVLVLDAEPLTALRTAAVATVALRALARPDARSIAVVGTGAQADAQLTLLRAVGAGAQVVLCGRSPERVRELAARHGVTAAPSVERAVRAADAVLCCTGADRPVLDRSWLRPGTHVSSVGGSRGPELDPATVRDAAALFVEWAGAAAQPPPAGAHELQGHTAAVLLGEVLSGRHPGRRSRDELTVFKSTGHAALDVAAAWVARETLSAS